MKGIVTITRVIMNGRLLQMLQLKLERLGNWLVMTAMVTKPIDIGTAHYNPLHDLKRPTSGQARHTRELGGGSKKTRMLEPRKSHATSGSSLVSISPSALITGSGSSPIGCDCSC